MAGTAVLFVLTARALTAFARAASALRPPDTEPPLRPILLKYFFIDVIISSFWDIYDQYHDY